MNGRNSLPILPGISFREVDEWLGSGGPSLQPSETRATDPASSSGTDSAMAISGASQGAVAHGHGRGDFKYFGFTLGGGTRPSDVKAFFQRR